MRKHLQVFCLQATPPASFMRKYLKNLTQILTVWGNGRNSTSPVEKYKIPSEDLPIQMIVYFNPEQPFPI